MCSTKSIILLPVLMTESTNRMLSISVKVIVWQDEVAGHQGALAVVTGTPANLSESRSPVTLLICVRQLL